MQDEADEMLSRGFKDQIYDVYRYLPPELQVTLGPYVLSANVSSNPSFMIIQSAIILPCLTLVIVPKAYLVSIFVISASPVVQIYTDYLLNSFYFITCLTSWAFATLLNEQIMRKWVPFVNPVFDAKK